MNKSALTAGAIAFVIFATIYLVISAVVGDVGGSQVAVAVVGGLLFGGLGSAIAMVVARRRTDSRGA